MLDETYNEEDIEIMKINSERNLMNSRVRSTLLNFLVYSLSNSLARKVSSLRFKQLSLSLM
jgi:hypothetical protein